MCHSDPALATKETSGQRGNGLISPQVALPAVEQQGLKADTSATNVTDSAFFTERTIRHDRETTSRTRAALQQDKNGKLKAFLQP